MTYPNLRTEEMRPETFEAFKAWMKEHSPRPGHRYGIVTSDAHGFFVRDWADDFADAPFDEITASECDDWISVFEYGENRDCVQVAVFSDGCERPIIGGKG